MGAVCCSSCHECEDYVIPNTSIYRSSTSLRLFLQNIVYTHTPISQRGEEHSRLASPSVSDNISLSEIYRSPPRPLPYDADTRYIRVQQDEEISGNEKGSNADALYAKSKLNSSLFENETKDSHMKSSLETSMNETTGSAHINSSYEDDECPTCLEEYTLENPKIITKCSHHFHLGCIYEWMERSETCPVCGKVMTFDEII